MTEHAALFDLFPPASTWAWPDRPRILVSYAYARKMADDDFAAFDGYDLILDSGAFTAHNSGKPIDHDAYVGWLQHAGPYARFAFALDVIGDPAASERNWLDARDRLGEVVQLVPTWHIGTPMPVFEDYCRRAPFVSVGGAVRHYRDQTYLWNVSKRLHDIARAHGTQLHGLGMTGRRIMRNLPWTSVDSSSWAIPARLPFLYLATKHGRMTSLQYGRPFPKAHLDLIRRYGGDPDGMDVEGWSLASEVGEEVAKVRKDWAVTASARAYMHVEATKPRSRPDEPFRLYLAAPPRDIGIIRAAHALGTPYPATEGTT